MAAQPQHNVVVWEWLTQPNRWKAYTPTVSQVLEKARRNKLTQVLLGDADPSLSQLRYLVILSYILILYVIIID